MASSPPSHDVSENRKRPRALSFMSGGTDVEFSSAGTSSNRSSLSSAGTCMDNVPAGTITLESVRGKRTQRTMEKYGEMVQNDPAYTLPEYTLHPTTIFENAIISNPDELSNMSLNGCSMQIKWDLVNRNFRILDVSMNPLYSSAVTPFTNNCETWDWDRMLVSYIYHRPVQLGNGIRAPTFSFMPLGLRSLPMPVEAGEPYPRGVMELEVSQRAAVMMRTEYYQYTLAPAAGGTAHRHFQFIVAIKIFQQSMRAMAVMWQKQEDGVFAVTTALDFGRLPLLESTKEAFAEELAYALPGVPVKGWLRVRPTVNIPALRIARTPDQWYLPLPDEEAEEVTGGMEEGGGACHGASSSSSSGSGSSGACAAAPAVQRATITVPAASILHGFTNLPDTVDDLVLDCDRALAYANHL